MPKYVILIPVVSVLTYPLQHLIVILNCSQECSGRVANDISFGNERENDMASPSYLVMKGDFVIIGKEPDGDSVRFIASNPDLYRHLHRAYRIKPSRDGSVQLRFEGVDAPELHYGSAAQPLGAEARDTVLSWMGSHHNSSVYQ